MKNKTNKVLAKITAYMCTKMAFSTSASACSLSAFQPKEPKCLKK
ncbi:cyclic lactone autoinducer peptide [Clostridiaceae bacterium UIB06]|uniref:Cyclic lactone autoinducer peptide n=1 Tax=Clostridium thailandense TaxID=2794346 RepID=A0A949TU44_9CLOT|nr:cyclic lactone autoinducer peptide [Clostridium thailandense]MBV7271405.1 cyclic lactone autoinducer peptide [Clostridium thailandense]MCH5136147.1 cyclic lactone autoinducer peptide [Clostridiaceae bacterium UIB06]